jgi:hypothetical protein
MVDYMTKFPQRCVITGHPNRLDMGDVLDLGVDAVDLHGRLYVSPDGAALIARHFGYILADSVVDDLAEAQREIERLQQIVDAIPALTEGYLDGLGTLSRDFVAGLLGVGSPRGDDLGDAEGDDGEPADQGEPAPDAG